jgi:MOSC domain-containing protein YiiM
MSYLVAVNVVHELIPGPKDSGWTAIDKRPRDGRVVVGELGLAGDTVCDTKHHGGPDQALYVYAREDAEFWATELDREIPPGQFGENLDTSGVAAGDPVAVLRRPDHDVTIGHLFTGLDPARAGRMLAAGIDLEGYVRDRAERAVSRARAC